VDGDGNDDLLYLNPGADGDGTYRGRLEVISSLSGFSGTFSADNLASFGLVNESVDYVYFGWAAVVADLDGDGADDALFSYMGDPDGVAFYPGYLWFLSDMATNVGSVSNVFEDADAIVSGERDYGQFGNRLALVGDFDGDGSDDVFASTLTGGTDGEGQVSFLDSEALVKGGSASDISRLVLQGDEPDNADGTADWFLSADFDGNGIQTLVVSQVFYVDSGSGTYAGRVFLIPGE
jgi:hypothetical protein